MTFFNDELGNEYRMSTEIKKYSTPKIHKGSDKDPRWYVYYSYAHPFKKNKNGTPLMQRVKAPTFGINRKYKTYDERLVHFTALRDSLENLLKRGVSPFDIKDNVHIEKTISTNQAIDYALSIKKMTVSDKTYKDYLSRSNKFKQYLDKHGYLVTDVKDITRSIVVNFLHDVVRNSSAANRNNDRGVLSTLFQILENEDFVEKNYFATTEVLKSKPKAHKIYSDDQANAILHAIDDPTLLRYVQMSGMGFLRPVSVCRIQIKDIDFENRIWTVNSKTKDGMRKRIPNVLFYEIEPFKNYEPDCYLITNDGVAKSDLSAEQRRDTFSKRHKKILKQLQIMGDFTVYSWRHYYTYKTFNALQDEFSFYNALDKLQEITGHTTRKALMKYLRSIEAVIPDDYSKYLK